MPTVSPPFPPERHPKIAQIYEYWLSIAPEGLLPGRRHFDPIAVARLLPNIWLLDVERDPVRFRYRLIGTQVAKGVGEDRTGQYMDSANPGFAQTAAWKTLRGMLDVPHPSWRRGPPEMSRKNTDILTMERIFLPLAADGVTVDTILALNIYTTLRGQEF